MTLRRVNVGQLSGLRAKPQHQKAGPECILCSHKEGRKVVVRSEELVEHLPGDGKTYARVLVKCHGQEELVTFEMGTRDWDFEHLSRLMGRHRWFDPKAMAGLAEER